MSDYKQSLVDQTATSAQAPGLGTKVVEWLIKRGVIAAQMTDCVLSEGQGYPPGPNWRDAVEDTSSDNFLELKTNGLEITTGRTVYHSWLEALRCPWCNAEQLEDVDWATAVDAWVSGDLPCLGCSDCGHTTSLLDWEFDRPWAFGPLGFTFWNWPNLSDDFIDECSAQLGHPLRKVVFIV